jgi:hypothetical protein
MKKILLLALSLTFSFAHAQSPKDFLKPLVWLKADHTAENAPWWTDQTNHKNHAIPLSGFQISPRGLINFNKALVFSGSNAGFEIPVDLSKASQLTIIAVYHAGDSLQEMGLWSTRINRDQTVFQSTQRGGGPQSISRYTAGNIDIPVVATTTQYWGKAGSGVANPALMLARALQDSVHTIPFRGAIAEFIVFDRMISEMEFQILQSYLSLKYGTTFQYNNYITYKGNLIWDFEAHEAYSYAIAGIGRDDDTGLYQKQSSSVEEPGLLTVGAGTIAATNQQNTYTLAKDNYLIWGMNGKDLQPERSEAEIYPYKYPVMNRKWKMAVHSSTASKIPTKIRFDASELLGITRECYLIIDRSATGDFSSETIEYIPASEISDTGIALFRNILWDTNGSGSDIFTFSFGMNNGVSCTHPLCHNQDTGTIDIEVMGSLAPYSFSLVDATAEYRESWESSSRFQHIRNLKAGTYELWVQGADGSVAKNTITIHKPEEFMTGLEKEYILKLGGKLVLDAGKNLATGGYHYLWNSDEGLVHYDQELIIMAPGTYTITISNELGCTVTETITVKAHQDLSYHYRLYPNPSDGDYTLDMVLAQKSAATVSVYNSLGMFISETRLDPSTHHMLKGHISHPGLYLLMIETDLGREVFKLIVTH